MARRTAMVPGAGDVATALARLADMPKADVVQRFKALFGSPPPLRMRREVLVRAVAFRIQEAELGGLDAALQRRLAKLVEELQRAGSITIEAPPPRIKPGTRLLRTWNGETHSVSVTGDGYVYRGETYRSLSKIARAITGTRWSGPAFFGLTKTAARPVQGSLEDPAPVVETDETRGFRA